MNIFNKNNKKFFLTYSITLLISIILFFAGCIYNKIFYIFFILFIIILPFEKFFIKNITNIKLFKVLFFHITSWIIFISYLIIILFYKQDINYNGATAIVTLFVLIFIYILIYAIYIVTNYNNYYFYNLFKIFIFLCLSAFYVLFNDFFQIDEQIKNVEKYQSIYVKDNDFFTLKIKCNTIFKVKKGLYCQNKYRELLLSSESLNKLSYNNIFKDPNFIILIYDSTDFFFNYDKQNYYTKLKVNYDLGNYYDVSTIQKSWEEIFILRKKLKILEQQKIYNTENFNIEKKSIKLI